MIEGVFYLGSILLANILVQTYGIVTVLGLTFPAGAVAIGLTFSARDFVQKRWGKVWCWGWMVLASGITLVFNMKLALASLCAFFVAEFIDWLIFTYAPFNFCGRIVASNLISTPLDSFIFVLLAFGPVWPAIWGQTIVKLVSSLIVIPFTKNKKSITCAEVATNE